MYEDNDDEICQFAESISDEQIIVIKIPSSPKRSLGELRNISIENSNGDYFCQWDADDWHHNQRLEIQMGYILSMHKPVCMLTYWIIFDTLTKKAYLSRKRLWEGSILCKKSVMAKENVAYPYMAKKEDFYFVEKLLNSNVIYPVHLPHLYIYVYHGDNTWDYNHFKLNFKSGKELSAATSSIITDIIENNYGHEKASELLSSQAVLEQMVYNCEFY